MPTLPRLLPCSLLVLILVGPAWADVAARKDAFGDPLPDGALMRLGTARFRAGPNDAVVRLSANGKVLAVGGLGNSIRLLDAADGTEIRRIQTDQLNPSGLTFNPAGDMLAAAAFDGSLRLWDVATGKPLGRIESKQFGMSSFVFSADGKTLVVAPQFLNRKGALHAYEVPGGKEIGSYEPVHTNNIEVAASSDGKMFASWGQTLLGASAPGDQQEMSQTVQIWDTVAGKEARRIETDHGAVSSVAFSPDGKILALAAGTGTVQFWDLAKGTVTRTFQGRMTDVQSLTFAPDGKSLFACSMEGGLQGWEIESGKRLCLADNPAGRICSLAFPPGGAVLACSQDSQEVIIWDATTGKTVAPRSGHPSTVGAVAFAADGRTLWSASDDGLLLRWDAATGKELQRLAESLPANDVRRFLPRGMGPGRAALRFSPGGEYLLSGGGPGNNLIDVQETATNQEAFAFSCRPGLNSSEGFAAAFSPDGLLLAAAEGTWHPNDSPRVLVWEPNSGREVAVLEGLKGQATALAISPDAKALAVAAGPSTFAPAPGAGSELFLWEVKSGKGPRVLKQWGGPGRGAPVSLSYSPDGRLMAAADRGAGVSVWDAETGVDRWQASPGGESVLAPALFSPDGRLLAVASQAVPMEEGHIRLWEVASGKVRREFAGRFGPITSLAFSPDGKTLATGCQDTTILLWDVAGTQTAEVKKNLNADALDALWADLASYDAEKAGRAVTQLAAAPTDAVPYLQKHVPPVEAKSVDEAAVAKLVADLNADDFDVRDKAQRELAEIGVAARPALQKALAGEPPPELKRRAEELLAKLDNPNLSPQGLRLRRAVEALERTGTPEARDWLDILSKGRPGADLTEDAHAALQRLDKRP